MTTVRSSSQFTRRERIQRTPSGKLQENSPSTNTSVQKQLVNNSRLADDAFDLYKINDPKQLDLFDE